MTVLPASRALAVLGLVAALVAGAGAVAAPPARASEPSSPCSATPFRSSPSASVWYRIPAIVRTDAGTLLAFAERRDSKDPSSDTGHTVVVVARSVDAGCSWSAPTVIAANGTDTVGNPAPVVDTTTGDVLLLTVDRPQGGTSFHGLHLQRSTDDGVTFTPYDESGEDLAKLPGWAGGLTGPGHAIQLTSGAHVGRIVVPIGYQRGTEHGAYAIISDDHGRTWRLGFDAAGDDHRQEGTIAQLRDGRLWISYHEQSASLPVGTGRIAALSSDGGATLSTGFARLGLPTVSVQASSLVLTGTHAGMTLVSSPGVENPAVREGMTIFVSRTAVPGSSWTRYPVTLESAPASYSDLVQVDDSTVGILYETGRTSWHEGIAYRSIPIAALTAGATVRSSASVTLPKVAKAGRRLVLPVRIAVGGTTAPPGTIRVALTKQHWTRTLTLPLKGDDRRVAFFPAVPRGTYTVTVSYSGTPRIKATTTRRTLRVR